MTETDSSQRYDFRAPRQLADDVEQTLSAWSQAFAMAIADGWDQHMGISLKWVLNGLSTTRRGRLVEELGDGQICCALGFEPDGGEMCLVLPRRFAVGMLLEMLGEPLTELPADRQLTDVETALMEVALHDAARHLTDSQPCAQPLVCCFSELQRTQDVFRKNSDQAPIVQVSFQVSAKYGGEQVMWLLSQQAVLRFMTNVSESRVTTAHDSAKLAETVRQIPFQLVVRLGSATVHLSDLMNLQPGDIVVLDQRVTEPLSADIGQVTKFYGWPGRVGRRQALQIASAVVPGEK